MFNISGFFNFVNHDILTQHLTSFGFNPKLTNLIKGFLTGHRTQISYNNFLSDPHDIPDRIPQGSPLSPILSILYGAPLLTIKDLTLHGITILAYVDDGILLTSSSSLAINSTRLQNAYPILEKALLDIGLIIQPKKLEVMHFTRGPDQENPLFHLPGLNRPILAPKSLCWLSFQLDRHLHFTHHTKILAAKATRTVHTMHILGNLVKGMSHPQLRMLTLTTISPIHMYSCQLWWGGKFSSSNTNHLQTALNGTLRLIFRGFQFTPVYALQHISHIPPIEHTIRKLSYFASICLHRLFPSNSVLTKILLSRPTINLRFDNLLTRLRLAPSKKSPLGRIAELSNTTTTPTLNPYTNPPGNEISPPTHASPQPGPLQKTSNWNTQKRRNKG